MNIVYFLLPVALAMGGSFAIWFVIAALRGQYDDLETPAHRMLLDDEIKDETKVRMKTASRTKEQRT